MVFRLRGSIPAVGSSKIIISGLPRRARATDTFRLLPPLNVPAYLFLYFLRHKLEINLLII